MENKGRKMLALGIVAMLCAVAIVGIGYAAFAGNAKTYNQGNATDVQFMTLTPGTTASADWNAITYNVAASEFNTYTYSDNGTKVAYYLTNPAGQNITISPNSYVNKNIGTKNFELKNNGASLTAIDVSAKPSIAIGNAEFVFIMGVKVGNGTESYQLINSGSATVMNFTDLAVTFAGGTETATITVNLYIGYVADGYIAPDYPIGAPGAQSETLTQGVNKSDVAPAEFTGLDFSFVVQEHTV